VLDGPLGEQEDVVLSLDVEVCAGGSEESDEVQVAASARRVSMGLDERVEPTHKTASDGAVTSPMRCELSSPAAAGSSCQTRWLTARARSFHPSPVANVLLGAALVPKARQSRQRARKQGRGNALGVETQQPDGCLKLIGRDVLRHGLGE